MAAEPRNLSSVAQTADKELVLTRILDAPCELVFQAWTEPERIRRWWGPDGFTTPLCQIDPRSGGSLRIDMRGPDGTVYPMTGTYNEVIPPKRLVFTSTPLDNQGNALFEIVNTVLFEPQGKKTKLTVRAKVVKKTPQAAPYLAGMEIGWSQMLDRLAKEVAQ